MGDGSNLCARLHHRMLHGTKVTYVNCARARVAVYQGAKEVPVEAYVMLHKMHKMAGFLGIKGKKVVQWMEVAGFAGFIMIWRHKRDVTIMSSKKY